MVGVGICTCPIISLMYPRWLSVSRSRLKSVSNNNSYNPTQQHSDPRPIQQTNNHQHRILQSSPKIWISALLKPAAILSFYPRPSSPEPQIRSLNSAAEKNHILTNSGHPVPSHTPTWEDFQEFSPDQDSPMNAQETCKILLLLGAASPSSL